MKRFAAIDIGSFELSMKIFEINTKGQTKELDHLRRRIELGTDTYNDGKISGERMDELCDSLLDFKRVMKSYAVSDVKAYGTSALRETTNTMIVLEQIKLRTGLDVFVLTNSEQRFLHYKAVASRGEAFDKCISGSAAIVDIGGGSIQISLFENGKLKVTQNLRLGILRMREMLHDLQPKTTDYSKLVGELIDNNLRPFINIYLENKQIETVILVDDYLSHIIQKAAKKDYITSKEYKAFLDKITGDNLEKAYREFDIDEESASLLPTSASLVRKILKYTGASKIWAPGVSLSDGIAYEFAEKEKYFKNMHDFSEDIISCAKNMSKRFNGNISRNELVEETCIALFDATKKIHNLSPREKLLLRVAAILSDCGRYISIDGAAECSYTIIMASELMGLSREEQEVVANIVKMNKTHFMYYDELRLSAEISKEMYLMLSKLSALFRVADGVCRSYDTKINGVKVSIKDNKVVLDVDSDADIILEKGFFRRKARLFEEVFAYKPVIKYKKKVSAL